MRPALTSAASRAEAYTDSKTLSETLFGNGAWISTSLQIASGAVGAGLLAWALKRTFGGSSKEFATTLSEKVIYRIDVKAQKAVEAAKNFMIKGKTAEQIINDLYKTAGRKVYNDDLLASMPFHEKYNNLYKNIYEYKLSTQELRNLASVRAKAEYYHAQSYNTAVEKAKAASKLTSRLFTGALYIAGAAATAYSAYSIGKKIYDYYNPTYDAVPEAMVDLIRTQDGDRYIKYDVVLEAKAKKDGGYAAGDLNAYKGQRWNALYYTKSYEAGKPLLAEFVLSNTTNRAGKDHLAVHRFGEEVCYDLNKYNFSNKSDNVFLSVAQSENQKSAVADVPDIVGSIFGAGMWLIAGAAGALVGVGGTLGVQALSKKKKASEADGSAE
jgi:hypothetical protein